MTYASQPYPAHRYELAYGVAGQVSTDQVYQPRTQDLVPVRTSYYDNAVGNEHRAWGSIDLFGSQFGVGWTLPVAGGPAEHPHRTSVDGLGVTRDRRLPKIKITGGIFRAPARKIPPDKLIKRQYVRHVRTSRSLASTLGNSRRWWWVALGCGAGRPREYEG